LPEKVQVKKGVEALEQWGPIGGPGRKEIRLILKGEGKCEEGRTSGLGLGKKSFSQWGRKKTAHCIKGGRVSSHERERKEKKVKKRREDIRAYTDHWVLPQKKKKEGSTSEGISVALRGGKSKVHSRDD